MDPTRQRVQVRHLAEHRTQEGGALLDVERHERDARARLRELVQHAHERVRPPGLRRRGNHERMALCAYGEARDHRGARRVGARQVVDRDAQRLCAGHVEQEAHERLAHFPLGQRALRVREIEIEEHLGDESRVGP